MENQQEDKSIVKDQKKSYSLNISVEMSWKEQSRKSVLIKVVNKELQTHCGLPFAFSSEREVRDSDISDGNVGTHEPKKKTHGEGGQRNARKKASRGSDLSTENARRRQPERGTWRSPPRGDSAARRRRRA